jgi:putative ABC transport system permease protein
MRAAFRHRRAPLVALVAAVALGAAIAAGCAGLLETALRLDTPPKRLAGADLVVAAPEHATLAAAGGRPAQPVTLSERPPLPDDVTATVGDVPGVGRATRVPGVEGALAVSVRPGASAISVKRSISAALSGRHLSVLSGDARGRAEDAGVAGDRLTLVLLAAVFGGMALVVMAILIGSIVSLSIEQRMRELGLLRTIGATPRQVRRMVVRRTMAPATIAALAGALAGPVLARALFARIQGGGVVADVVALRQGVLSAAAGVVAALLATRVSVAVAAHRATRARMTQAVDEGVGTGSLGKVRLALAAVAASGAASCAVMTMFMPAQNAAATGGGTAVAGAIACAFIAPLLAERFADRFGPIAQRIYGVPGALAAANVRVRAHRTGALLTPVILVVSIALANVYQQTTQGHAMRQAYVDGLRADAVVTSSGGRPLPASAVAAARSAGQASALVDSKGWIEHPVDPAHRIDPLRLVGVEPSALRSPVEAGSPAALRGDAVALPEGLAHKLGVAVGDRIGIVLGDGAHVRLRVAALLGGSSRYPALVLPPAVLAPHTTGGVHELLVTGDGDVPRRVRDALGAAPGAVVRDAGALGDDFDTGLRVDRWITFAVVGVILAYAAMSLVNLLVAALGGRRRELALLRLAGATRDQVTRMLQAEALLVAGTGAAVGTVLAIAGLIPLAIATAGSPLPSGPVTVFLGTLLVALALVLVPTLAGARVILRDRPAAAVERT